jgi:hypothetical protein
MRQTVVPRFLIGDSVSAAKISPETLYDYTPKEKDYLRTSFVSCMARFTLYIEQAIHSLSLACCIERLPSLLDHVRVHCIRA